MDWESKGKYSAHLFTERAQKIIRQHANTSGDEVILVLIKNCHCYTEFQAIQAFFFWGGGGHILAINREIFLTPQYKSHSPAVLCFKQILSCTEALSNCLLITSVLTQIGQTFKHESGHLGLPKTILWIGFITFNFSMRLVLCLQVYIYMHKN